MAENDNTYTLPALTAANINGIVTKGENSDGTYNITYTNLTREQIKEIGDAFEAAMQEKLKKVALNGEYNDLNVKPGIPSGYTQESNFNKIAFSGKASDLDNTNNNGEQVFLTSFTESDPVFAASAAATITDTNITNWNNKSEFSGDYNDLESKPNHIFYINEATNNNLKYLTINSYCDTTEVYYNNNEITIDVILNNIITMYTTHLDYTIKIYSTIGLFLINNIGNRNGVYTFTLSNLATSNFNTITQFDKTNQEILEEITLDIRNPVLIYDSNNHILYIK